MLRTPYNSGLIECLAGHPIVPRPGSDLDEEVSVALAQIYGKDHPSEGRLDLFEELEDRAPPLFQLSGYFEDRGRTRGVALDLYGICILYESCFYAFFGSIFSVSPDHPGKPPHQSTNPQILASAKICRKRLDTLPLPDAGTTRVAPGASRTVHGQRERHLAGPDGLPTLGERQGAGEPCRTRPLRRAVRRPVLQSALSRLRDCRDHTRPCGFRGRGRPRRRPEREEWRYPRRPHLGRAGAAPPRAGKEVPRHPRRGTLGARRRRDGRGGYREVRRGPLLHPRPPPRRWAHRYRLARRGNAGVSEGAFRTRGPARRPAGGQRFDNAPAMGRNGPASAGGGFDSASHRRSRLLHCRVGGGYKPPPT